MKYISYLFLVLIFLNFVYAQSMQDITLNFEANEVNISDGETPSLLDDKNTMIKVTSLVILLFIVMWIVSYRANQKRMHRDL